MLEGVYRLRSTKIKMVKGAMKIGLPSQSTISSSVPIGAMKIGKLP